MRPFTNLLATILLLFVFWPSTGSTSAAGPQGGGGTFPVGTEIDFPWDDIEGLWYSKNSSSLFHFRINAINPENGTRVLTITHYLPTHRGDLKPVASQRCTARTDQKVVNCMLEGHNLSYMVRVSAYHNTRHDIDKDDTAVILTLRPIGGDEDSDVEFWLKKIALYDPADAFEGESR